MYYKNARIKVIKYLAFIIIIFDYSPNPLHIYLSTRQESSSNTLVTYKNFLQTNLCQDFLHLYLFVSTLDIFHYYFTYFGLVQTLERSLLCN